jgi:hypothetical protein
MFLRTGEHKEWTFCACCSTSFRIYIKKKTIQEENGRDTPHTFTMTAGVLLSPTYNTSERRATTSQYGSTSTRCSCSKYALPYYLLELRLELSLAGWPRSRTASAAGAIVVILVAFENQFRRILRFLRWVPTPRNCLETLLLRYDRVWDDVFCNVCIHVHVCAFEGLPALLIRCNRHTSTFEKVIELYWIALKAISVVLIWL